MAENEDIIPAGPTQDYREAQAGSNDDNGYDKKALRHLFGRKVKSVKKFIKKRFDEEINKFLDVYRGDVERILPERVKNFTNVDVNVVYPVIKTLIPSLYFQDPKVYIKAEQEKIVIEHSDEMGQPLVDPMTGAPMVTEYNAVAAAAKFQAKLNDNIKKAKLKREMKAALTDAELMYYGALQCGWGNEQGVESMGEGAPASHRDDTDMDMAYGIRLKPWDVFVDMDDFYHPAWIAVRYEVHPEQLKQDPRLQNTEDLKGNCETKDALRDELYQDLDKDDYKKTEYFAFYHKPCAQYPEGIYAIFTDEVADDFLYFGPWPYAADETRKTFPVKLIYFNEDPQGGLPIPGVRYYIEQQRGKSTLRRIMYEYVQRTLPMMGVDITKVDEVAKQKISSGQLPRIVPTKGNPGNILNGISFNNLNADFTKMDMLLDDDIDKMSGVGNTGAGNNVEFAEVAKQAQANQQVRNGEKADIVRDFMIDIVKFWGGLHQEFGSEEMSTPMDEQDFPVQLSVNELQGKFNYDIKPFSMNYEDPMILRRQWVDLLNLALSPQSAMALNSQGVTLDYAKIWKRVLMTYDDPEVHAYLKDQAASPEAQVSDAIQENMGIMKGVPAQVLPTDNHQVHIMIHGTMPDAPGKLEHILAHQQAMLEAAPQKSGGGNPEGLPVKGVAANQDMMQQSLKPSMPNQSTAIQANGLNPMETR